MVMRVDNEFSNSELCYVECLQFLQDHYVNPCIQYFIQNSSDVLPEKTISCNGSSVLSYSTNSNSKQTNKGLFAQPRGVDSSRQHLISSESVDISSIQVAEEFLDTVRHLCSCHDAIQMQLDKGVHFCVALSNVKDLLLEEYCRYLRVSPFSFVKVYRNVVCYLSTAPTDGVRHDHMDIDCSLSSLIAMPIRRIANYRDLTYARLKELDKEIEEARETESMQKEASLLCESDDERSSPINYSSCEAETSDSIAVVTPAMLRLYEFRFQLLTCAADMEAISSVLEGMVSRQHSMKIMRKYKIEDELLTGDFIREEEFLLKVPSDGLFNWGKFELRPCVLILMSDCLIIVQYSNNRRVVQKGITNIIPLSAVSEATTNKAVLQSLVGVDNKSSPLPGYGVTVTYFRESEREKTLFFYSDVELDIVNFVTDIVCAFGKL